MTMCMPFKNLTKQMVKINDDVLKYEKMIHLPQLKFDNYAN